MKHFALAAAIAVAFPGIAAAEAATDPSDPSSPAPAPAYRSAFEGLPAGVEQEQVDWRQANADVARFPRGHADYVKWEEQQQGGSGQPGAAAAPPAAPPAGATPPAREQGHRHH